MNRIARLKLILLAVLVPLIAAGCFSTNPTRDGNSDRTGTGTGDGTDGDGTRPTTQSGDGSSSGSTRGHRGTPDSPTQSPETGTFGLPQPGASSGEKSDRNSPSDIRVAKAEKSSTDGSGTDEGQNDIGGSALPDQPEVSVEEALEGANAAVDAAAGAVAEAESTIARAREEADAGGGGEKESFDPWAKSGSDKASESGENSEGDQSDADEKTGKKSTGRPDQDEAEQNDSFDPFADYGDEEGQENERLIPRGKSLQTADDALAAANAALNRARRSLIKAAGSDSGDADAEAVQLAAARAAMEAAAEAVIASAIAVMAASDAFADDSGFNEEDAEAAQERLADGIAMVVAITQRDMKNAAEALEATSELLSAAGSLIGILGNSEEQQDDSEDLSEGTERVASLEKQLDRSLTVFDDRMEAEGRTIGSTMGTSDDSETATLNAPNEVSRTSGNTKVSGRATANDGGAMRDEQIGDPSVKERYETPGSMARTETEELVIAQGRPQDDDIVARQLREAAMAETDPELREALWKEYKNYKESLETGEAEANP